MDREFCKTWFSCFADGIDEMDAAVRSALLRHCARRCADTGVLSRDREHYLDVGEIWGRNRFTVMCEGTILSGAPKCCFRVIFQEE